MEKRLVIFLVLSISILVFYPILLEKMFGIRKIPPKPVQSTQGIDTISKNIEYDIQDIGLKSDQEILETTKKTIREEEIVIETDLLRVVLSNRGAVIKKWELKKYRENIRENAKRIELLRQDKVEMYPLDITIAGKGYGDKIFQIIGEKPRFTGGKEKGTLSFIYEDLMGGGILEKKLTFFKDSYRVEIEITRKGLQGDAFIFLGENFGITDWGKKQFVGYVGPMSLVNGKVEKDPLGKDLGDIQHFGNVRWAALQDKYYVTALLPSQEKENRVLTKKFGEERGTIGLELHKKTEKIILYAGPKEYERLKALQAHLEETIDFGWFIYGSWTFVRIVAKPLFSILNFFYGLTHNYGFSIIFLTVLIKILFIPLTHKSHKSMKSLQKVQPQMQALQKKYKNNKEKLNKEMLDLYRTHKVNPLGGCLPMFLQIPFFIALFNILYTTIELRQAPFIFWIMDLSDKDPFYVLPVIMGATMFIQQKIQPTTLDPKQAKIMMFLPVIFTFLFLNFSSGLVLYWMTNNILTIAQQYVTTRYFSKE